MKISELSERTGLPLPTIKFYLREGLLPAGELSRPNQATYGDRHVRRLRLVRALREAGGLSLNTIKDLCRAIDNREMPLIDLLGEVADAMGETNRAVRSPGPAHERARKDVDGFLAANNLPVRESSVARDTLIDALVAFREAFGEEVPVEAFRTYLDAIRPLAEAESRQAIGALNEVFSEGAASDTLEYVVYGTVLVEPVLLSLRRLVHEQVTLNFVLNDLSRDTTAL